jgi:hypothetical protein
MRRRDGEKEGAHGIEGQRREEGRKGEVGRRGRADLKSW